jgi:hypothetical protein
VEGVLYYPYLSLPNGPWVITTLLYWDTAATIAPWRARDEFDALTRELVDSRLLSVANPDQGDPYFGEQWFRYVDGLAPGELSRRLRSFQAGNVVRLHRDKVTYQPGFERLVDLHLADAASLEDRSQPWITVEAFTAHEYMAAMAISLTGSQSHFSRYGNELWIPSTDSVNRLSWLCGEVGIDDELHALRLEVHDSVSQLRAVVLNRLLPVPDGAQVDLESLSQVRRRFGEEMRQFRRFIEHRLLELATEPDPGRQLRQIDLMGEEFEDEIRRVEEYLRRAGVEKVTRSTLVQLARHLDVSGTADRISRAAEDVIGGQVKTVGPLAYASIVRMEVYGRRTAPVIFELPERGLAPSLNR